MADARSRSPSIDPFTKNDPHKHDDHERTSEYRLGQVVASRQLSKIQYVSIYLIDTIAGTCSFVHIRSVARYINCIATGSAVDEYDVVVAPGNVEHQPHLHDVYGSP